MLLTEFYNLHEVNSPDELTVSKAVQNYFENRGYQYIGEGRDQIAYLSPRDTVVKIVGLGNSRREEVVRNYVDYFVNNQNNLYYPKIYNTGEFEFDGKTYFIYEMEYLFYVAEEDYTLEYLEDLMYAVANGSRALAAFQQNHDRPSELTDTDVTGLLAATKQLINALGNTAHLDLSQVENIRRRTNGHLVITDPFSL